MEYDLSGGVSSYYKMGGSMSYYTPQATFEYDVAGRPIHRLDQDGLSSRIEYYANSGLPKDATDPAGVINRYTYDRYGRLATRQVLSAVGVVRTINMDYEPDYGRIRSVTDNGQTTRFTYQERGRRYAGVLGDPYKINTSEVPFTDALGTTHTVSTTYQGYDALGRSLGYQSADDLGNNLPHMAVSFDSLGRVTQYDTEVSQVRTEYEDYNLATEEYGRVKGLRYDLNNDASNHELVQTLNYYKSADIPTPGPAEVASVYGLQLGKLKSRSYQLGSRSASEALPTGLGQVYRRMSYDGLGRLESVNGYLGNQTRKYQYDGASRLTRSEQYQGATSLGGQRYQYDLNGNPLSTQDLSAPGVEGNYRQEQSYGLSNRLTSYIERFSQGIVLPTSCKKELAYDTVGRLLQDPTNCNTRYSWDVEGHLTRVQYDENNWTQIDWNGSNQWTRIIEVVNGNPKDDKTYVWPMGGNTPSQIRDTVTGNLLTSFNGDGYQTYHYDGLGNISTERFILLRDHQGSVIGLTNQQGEQIEAIEYDDWGTITKHQTRNAEGAMEDVSTARTNTRNLPIQYAGYFFLKRADLALTPNRAYHPKLKRWLSKDPIAEAGGDNLYMYVVNMPNMAVDQSGLNPIRVDFVHVWMAKRFLSGEWVNGEWVSGIYDSWISRGLGSPRLLNDFGSADISGRRSADGITESVARHGGQIYNCDQLALAIAETQEFIDEAARILAREQARTFPPGERRPFAEVRGMATLQKMHGTAVERQGYFRQMSAQQRCGGGGNGGQGSAQSSGAAAGSGVSGNAGSGTGATGLDISNDVLEILDGIAVGGAIAAMVGVTVLRFIAPPIGTAAGAATVAAGATVPAWVYAAAANEVVPMAAAAGAGFWFSQEHE